jgi:hypothetical protein
MNTRLLLFPFESTAVSYRLTSTTSNSRVKTVLNI